MKRKISREERRKGLRRREPDSNRIIKVILTYFQPLFHYYFSFCSYVLVVDIQEAPDFCLAAGPRWRGRVASVVWSEHNNPHTFRLHPKCFNGRVPITGKAGKGFLVTSVLALCATDQLNMGKNKEIPTKKKITTTTSYCVTIKLPPNTFSHAATEFCL